MEDEEREWRARIERKLDLVLKMRHEFELMKKIFAGLWAGVIVYLGIKKS